MLGIEAKKLTIPLDHGLCTKNRHGEGVRSMLSNRRMGRQGLTPSMRKNGRPMLVAQDWGERRMRLLRVSRIFVLVPTYASARGGQSKSETLTQK